MCRSCVDHVTIMCRSCVDHVLATQRMLVAASLFGRACRWAGQAYCYQWQEIVLQRASGFDQICPCCGPRLVASSHFSFGRCQTSCTTLRGAYAKTVQNFTSGAAGNKSLPAYRFRINKHPSILNQPAPCRRPPDPPSSMLAPSSSQMAGIINTHSPRAASPCHFNIELGGCGGAAPTDV